MPWWKLWEREPTEEKTELEERLEETRGFEEEGRRIEYLREREVLPPTEEKIIYGPTGEPISRVSPFERVREAKEEIDVEYLKARKEEAAETVKAEEREKEIREADYAVKHAVWARDKVEKEAREAAAKLGKSAEFARWYDRERYGEAAPEEVIAWIERAAKEVGEEEAKRAAELKKVQEAAEREKWVKRAAAGAAVGAGIHTAKELGRGGVGVAKGVRRAIVPQTRKREEIAGLYTGRPDVKRLYGMGAPSREPREMIPAGRALAVGAPARVEERAMIPAGKALVPGRMPEARGDGLDRLRQAGSVFATSPIAQLATGRQPMPTTWPTRRPTTMPMPTPTPSPALMPGIREVRVPEKLEEYMRAKGQEPIEPYSGEVYFWIGPKRRWTRGQDAWVVQLQTGRFGLAGFDPSGVPRSKISMESPEEAFELAVKGPKPGEVVNGVAV